MFQGFPKGGDRFLHELALEQSREWFIPRKEEYERLWEDPMRELLDEVHAALVKVYRPIALAPPKVFRIQRDVRFSKEKVPYKTSISAVLMLDVEELPVMQSPAALYLQLGTERFLAAGAYQLDGERLTRYRDAVADDRSGKALEKIIAALAKQGGTVGAHGVLARVPKGFDPEHPRATLLKNKGLMIDFDAPNAKLCASRELVGHLVERAKLAKPLLAWILEHVLDV